MNSDQLYLTEYFHHLFSLDQKNAVREWVTAFDVYRSAWLWEECSWMLRLVKGLPLEEESGWLATLGMAENYLHLSRSFLQIIANNWRRITSPLTSPNLHAAG